MKNAVLAFLVVLLCAGVRRFHVQRKSEANKPTTGQTTVTTVTTIDDVITFNPDMTFSVDQGYRQTVDGVLRPFGPQPEERHSGLRVLR